MNRVVIKKVVCLVNEEELKRLQAVQRSRQHPNAPGTSLKEHVWREIQVVATSEGVSVHLGNIDEDGARSGHWNAAYACATFKCTWVDLADVSGLENMLQFEALVVAKTVLAILSQLKEMSGHIQATLAI